MKADPAGAGSGPAGTPALRPPRCARVGHGIRSTEQPSRDSPDPSTREGSCGFQPLQGSGNRTAEAAGFRFYLANCPSEAGRSELCRIRHRPDSRGFTLVETILAVALGLLVLGIAVGLLWLASSAFTRAEQRMAPRETAHLALTTLTTALRDAWHYQIDPGGARLRFVTPHLAGETGYERSSGRLLYTAPGSRAAPEVLADHVKDFRVESRRPGCVRLMLELERPETTGKMKSLGNLRVVAEVFIPAIGLRDPAVPWSRCLEHKEALQPSG